MAANPKTLLEKLKILPPQRLVEVEDFVDFLARKEIRTAAFDRLLAVAATLETAGISPLSDAEISVEIKAARAERRTHHPQQVKAKTGDRA